MKSLTIILVLLLSGCACKWDMKDYYQKDSGTLESSAKIEGSFYIRVIGTDHSGSAGATCDIRDPYSLNIRLFTTTAISAFEISSISILNETGVPVEIFTYKNPLRIKCIKSNKGSFLGEQNLDTNLYYEEDLFKLDIKGILIIDGVEIPFKWEQDFELHQRKKRWMSFNELMSV